MKETVELVKRDFTTTTTILTGNCLAMCGRICTVNKLDCKYVDICLWRLYNRGLSGLQDEQRISNILRAQGRDLNKKQTRQTAKLL